MRRLSLTSWSVHPLLQTTNPASNGSSADAALRLTELPGRMRDAGIGTLEICHFHIPSTDADYLSELRAAIDEAGIELFSILIDTGDISQADKTKQAADMRTIEHWIDVAAQLGAKVVRIIAGDAAPDDSDALERSIASLRVLSEYAQARGVRVLTENFKALASTAANCNRILDELGGTVGLCADIGNFPAASRVEEFSAVASRAESVHAKAAYSADGTIEPEQMRQCLDASAAAGFSGPYTLVFDRPAERWSGITVLKQIVAPYTQSA
jgi:sugar phosphate isomerase/epimerase